MPPASPTSGQGLERLFAWIIHNRQLWKDPKATFTSARALHYAFSVALLI
jgi:putative transposase